MINIEQKKHNNLMQFVKWCSKRGWYKNTEYLSPTQISQMVADEANKILKNKDR